MAYRGQGQKVQKVYLHNRSWIQVWLCEQVNIEIEGCIIGFDEYMSHAKQPPGLPEEIHSKTKSGKQWGRIIL
ncbi:unnamed protein product [Nyctereutes procyonoides]|uniref:(raccoon dog) hypothetical protein n=1 Tax=Nyctereutes procyonoides TaxID=34880 RepID=A0A811ZWT0_NYCPR|nr:unnamed protein product [Nyctereutes procyonoides]